jgi:hypothetical protein
VFSKYVAHNNTKHRKTIRSSADGGKITISNLFHFFPNFLLFFFFFVLVTARWSGDEFSFDQVLDARSITFHELQSGQTSLPLFAPPPLFTVYASFDKIKIKIIKKMCFIKGDETFCVTQQTQSLYAAILLREYKLVFFFESISYYL